MSAIVAILALVAHLWMLDAPPVLHSPPVTETSVVSMPAPATTMSGCAGGMTACRVPLPPGSVLALIVALASVVVVRPLQPDLPAGAEHRGSVDACTERSPPGLRVTESVVLLV